MIFRNDTEAELELVRKAALENGAFDAVISTHWSDGGSGCLKLAEAVEAASKEQSKFEFLYDLNMPIKSKISKIATEMYGAAEVSYSENVLQKIEQYEKQVIITFF